MNAKILTLAAAVGAAFVSPAMAFNGTIGAGVHMTQVGYLDTDAKAMLVPAIDIENDMFYFKGFEGGAYLLKTDTQRVTAGLTYMPLAFDPDDSDDARMKKLDERKGSLFATVGYTMMGQWGVVRAQVAGDVMSKSNGLMADVSYLKRFQVGQWGLTPQAGAVWTNKKFNNYYFGISQAEADRSGLRQYQAKGGVSPYARLMADWKFADKWTFYAETSIRAHSKEISDSDMMDKKVMTSAGCGVSYIF